MLKTRRRRKYSKWETKKRRSSHCQSSVSLPLPPPFRTAARFFPSHRSCFRLGLYGSKNGQEEHDEHLRRELSQTRTPDDCKSVLSRKKCSPSIFRSKKSGKTAADKSPFTSRPTSLSASRERSRYLFLGGEKESINAMSFPTT